MAMYPVTEHLSESSCEHLDLQINQMTLAKGKILSIVWRSSKDLPEWMLYIMIPVSQRVLLLHLIASISVIKVSPQPSQTWKHCL